MYVDITEDATFLAPKFGVQALVKPKVHEIDLTIDELVSTMGKDFQYEHNQAIVKRLEDRYCSRFAELKNEFYDRLAQTHQQAKQDQNSIKAIMQITPYAQSLATNLRTMDMVYLMSNAMSEISRGGGLILIPKRIDMIREDKERMVLAAEEAEESMARMHTKPMEKQEFDLYMKRRN